MGERQTGSEGPCVMFQTSLCPQGYGVVSGSGQMEGDLPTGSTQTHVSSEGFHVPSFLDVFGLQHHAGGLGEPTGLVKGGYRGPVPSGEAQKGP